MAWACIKVYEQESRAENSNRSALAAHESATLHLSLDECG